MCLFLSVVAINNIHCQNSILNIALVTLWYETLKRLIVQTSSEEMHYQHKEKDDYRQQ